jgi:phosphoglycerate dehydrogenase-like enzyme
MWYFPRVTPDTRKSHRRGRTTAMQPSAFLINISREAFIDEKPLSRFEGEEDCRRPALDVTSP